MVILTRKGHISEDERHPKVCVDSMIIYLDQVTMSSYKLPFHLDAWNGEHT